MNGGFAWKTTTLLHLNSKPYERSSEIARFRRRVPPRKSSIILLIARYIPVRIRDAIPSSRVLPLPRAAKLPANDAYIRAALEGPPLRYAYACVRAAESSDAPHFKDPMIKRAAHAGWRAIRVVSFCAGSALSSTRAHTNRS